MNIKEKVRSVYHFLSPGFQTIHLEYKVNNQPRYGYSKPVHPGLNSIINNNRNVYAETLKEFLQHKDYFKSIKLSSDNPDSNDVHWSNEYLPGLDIISLYGMIRKNKPGLYIEVGSGNSTKVARKAIADNGKNAKIISIDPYPRASIDKLADEIMRVPFESIRDYSFLIDNLNPNDILFIDNSHRVFPNSDATVFFMEILPYLKKGVIVQIHDIYLPFDYPQFMCDRFYSEQYALAISIINNPERYKVLFPSYFIHMDPELSSVLNPLWNDLPPSIEKHGGSFWLQIN